MRQRIVLFSLLTLILTALAPAQDMSKDEFRKTWAQGVELEEDKLLDKAMKRGSLHAISYFEALWRQASTSSNVEAEAQCERLMASWQRCFETKKTLEEVQRWVDGCDNPTYTKLQSIRTNSSKLWNDYLKNVVPTTDRSAFEGTYNDFVTLSKAAESIGHNQEAADLWTLASIVCNKMPERTIEDRENALFALEQSLSCRERWGYTFDTHYTGNKLFIESERQAIKEDQAKSDKRKAEGYDGESKGVDSLLMPNVEAAKHPLTFAPLKEWQKELDYGPRGGPAPPFWWLDSLGEKGASRKMGWFRQRDMYLLRRGANDFAVNWEPNDTKTAVELDIGSRGKPSTFYLGSDKQLPYAMFFWMGTDQETTGVAKCNYAANESVANIYYRSASSWLATVGEQTVTYYDDDCSGRPGNDEPFGGEFRSHLIGDNQGEGVLAPLIDSMRIGKGKRVPYSQFVKLEAGWFYQKITGGSEVSIWPLNPEYYKTGKVKMSWKGAKPTVPDQLVIQGKGDIAGAVFDLASQKEIELPVGEYSVIFGRMVHGKGARVQMAQIYPSDESESFVIKEGETLTLEMGAPLRIEFVKEGSGKDVTIDATSIHVRDKSGLMITAMHGMSIDCDVMAAKNEKGKGKKEIGSFVPFTSAELIGTASQNYPNLGFLIATYPLPKGYKEGELKLTAELPAEGMKVGLFVKKHKFFGKLETVWK
ncbi:MAG: hypothetical protein AB8H80_21285 [Planctomycetota bacterium]